MFDLREESARLAAEAAIDWAALEGRRVMITGVTGLVGSHCARFLMERNRACGCGITVVAPVRSLERAAEALAGYGPADGLELMECPDLAAFSAFDTPVDYIVHAACPTASRFFMEHPVETLRTITESTYRMLELARLQQARGLVYISSMEVYGDGNPAPGLEQLLSEDKVGYVNPLSTRSCYPEGKRMAEQLVAAYASQHGVHGKVLRLAQTFGPGIAKTDTRVFAMMARCAMTGEDIVLKTTGASTRMYCYPTDAVTAIFTALLAGQDGHAYNAANPATYCSVREMGEAVARQNAGGAIKVVLDVDPNAPYPPEHHLPLDTGALQALGWRPQVGLAEMFARLIAYLS